MHKKWVMALIIGIIASLIHSSTAKETPQVTCTGKVVDAQGRAITGANVRFYRLILSMEILSIDVELVQELATEDNGTFTIKTQADSSNQTGQTIILVEKEGLALGWVNWELNKNLDVEIQLGRPGIIAGKVIDESGEPISDAEVSISIMTIPGDEQPRYLTGNISERLFSRKTDAGGRFKFESIPVNATAEFILKKTGMTTVSTLDPKYDGSRPFQFAAGQENIAIKIPAGGGIEGTVINKNTGMPVSGVRLIIFQGQNNPFSGHEAIFSKGDGTFSFDSLGPGKYVIQAVTEPGKPADWLAQPLEVSVDAGKVETGVKLELSKGGIVEVIVTEDDNNTPVEGTIISFQNTVSKELFGSETGKDGIIRKRLAPGEYKITNLYKRDYPSQSKNEIFTVRDEQTSRVSIRISGYPKVAGIVKDESSRPIAGARMKVCPLGRGETTSDRDGKYELRWESRESAQGVVPYVVARHFERNLAAAVEIEENVKIIDINMTDGVICTGKVVDTQNKPIEDARIYLTFWSSGYGTSMAHDENKTDAEGSYEIRAVPVEHEYSVNASRDGYGSDYIRIRTYEDENNRLNVEPITLALANLSISGTVVDVDNKPVADARVSCQGRGQPDRFQIPTDQQGRFKIEGVCSGEIRLWANVRGESSMYGSLESQGGAADVKIIVAERSSSGGIIPKQAPSLVGKSLPELQTLGIELLPDTNNKIVLVCFFDMEQRPSRNCIMQLSKRAQELQEKDVTVVAIQASKIDRSSLVEWVKEYKIPFTVGMIGIEQEKARFAWGIRSLPWLILTDKEHVVIAEGFSITELDKKIEESEDAEQ